jgi:hypothetical protein
LSFNGGKGLGWWWHRLLGRGFRDAIHSNFGVIFNNLEYTIGAFVSVNCRDFFDKLWLWFRYRNLLGRRKTILLLEKIIF